MAAIINGTEQPLPVDMSMFHKAWLILACFGKSLKFVGQGVLVSSWNFLSNHAAVLVLVATESSISAAQIGVRLGITERPVRRIIAELEREGYLFKTREGRSNRYSVNPNLPIPGPITRDLAVKDLLRILKVYSGINV